MKILVTGAAGMLGAAVVENVHREDWEVVLTGRTVGRGATVAMDISDWQAVRNRM
jgi:nucleoside-diphosphate-sugar epimerase